MNNLVFIYSSSRCFTKNMNRFVKNELELKNEPKKVNQTKSTSSWRILFDVKVSFIWFAFQMNMRRNIYIRLTAQPCLAAFSPKNP